MSTNQLYSIWYARMAQLRPGERITRLRNLAWLITAIFHSRSVQLGVVAPRIPSRAKLPSVVRHLSRFLDNSAVRVRPWYAPVARSWLESIIRTTGTVQLIADGTQIGPHHQLLMVAAAFRRRAIPIAWTWVRSGKGRSSAYKQLALLEYVHRLIPPGTPVCLVGDNEFGSVDVMRRLDDWHWQYVLRQRSYTQIREPNQAWQDFGRVVSQPGQQVWLEQTPLTLTRSYPTNLLAYWQVGEKEPWLLATNLPDASVTLRSYARRMWIEEMFGDLKGKGFNLATSHLQTCEHLSRLTLAVVLLYTWLVDLGQRIIKNGLRQWVDRTDRRDLSIFQIGFRSAERRLINGMSFRFAPINGSLSKLSGN